MTDWHEAGCARDCTEQHTYTPGRCALAVIPDTQPRPLTASVEPMPDGMLGIVVRARPTASTITDTQLDQLYEQLERAQRVAMHALDAEAAAFEPDDDSNTRPKADPNDELQQRLSDALRRSWDSAVNVHRDDAIRRDTEVVLAELRPELDALVALRQVARGYCPACGRGDAAPTVEDWEQQRQRADEAEGRLAHLQASSEAVGRFLTRTVDERNQLRAALARVHALAEEYPAGIDTALIHAALDLRQHPPAGAATQATDRPA